MAEKLDRFANNIDGLLTLNEALKRITENGNSKLTSENLTGAFFEASKELVNQKKKKLAIAYKNAGVDFSKVDFDKINRLVSKLYPLTKKVKKIADKLAANFDFGEGTDIQKTLKSFCQKQFPELGVTDVLINYTELNGVNSGRIAGTLMTSSGKIVNREFSMKNGKVTGIHQMSEQLKAEFKEPKMFCPNCGQKVISGGCCDNDCESDNEGLFILDDPDINSESDGDFDEADFEFDGDDEILEPLEDEDESLDDIDEIDEEDTDDDMEDFEDAEIFDDDEAFDDEDESEDDEEKLTLADTIVEDIDSDLSKDDILDIISDEEVDNDEDMTDDEYDMSMQEFDDEIGDDDFEDEVYIDDDEPEEDIDDSEVLHIS